jgi:hypothetical protein
MEITMAMEALPIWCRQETFAEFRQAYEKEKESGEILIFVGSGLSINAGLPNWPTLLNQLASEWGAAHPGSPRRAKLKKLLEERKYPPAGDLIRKLYPNDLEFRQALRNTLHAAPTALHHALESLPWSRIITTNYDLLIEEVCKGVPAVAPSMRGGFVVSNVPTVPVRTMASIDSETDRLIFKIHGSIGVDSSTIVIGKSDYADLYESDRKAHVLSTLQTLIRRSKLILFIGYGHRDPYFQNVWKLMRVGLHEVKNAFALVPIEGMPDEFERNLANLDAVGVRFIAYSAHDDYSELLQFLDYLKDPQAGDRELLRIASIRRPTVVMVFCGGTIGADDTERIDEKLAVNRQTSRYGYRLEKLKGQLRNWYGDFYNAGHDLNLEIEWEILPVEWQIFSENATPEYWTVLEQKVQQTIFKYMLAPDLVGKDGVLMPTELLDLYRTERDQHALAFGADRDYKPLNEKQFIIDISNRFVLGIVMLVGTDTLAYSAAALSCGLQYLPCPVVITGANQAPGEKRVSLIERGRFFLPSDTWRNLMTAMYFLQTFGYSLTEVFVCFGDTVHHGVNLRKISAELLGPGAEVPRGGEREPFTFRSLTFRSQYMFKMIDGMFCNNYYPRDSLSFAALVGMDSPDFEDLSHVRKHLLSPSAEGLRVQPPSPLVWHVAVSPAFPRVTLHGLDPELWPRVVLVEGYVSGTHPSALQIHFLRLIKELYQARIPLFLTAPFGIQGSQAEYQTEEFEGVDMGEAVCPLFGVIEETALPLLAHVVGRIPLDQWENAQSVRDRHRLISDNIDEYFHKRPNILTREFIGVTEPDKQVDRHDKLLFEARKGDRSNVGWDHTFALFEGLRSRIVDEDNPQTTVPGGAAPHSRLKRNHPVTLTRAGFLSTVEQIVRPYQQIGAGPDGFSTLSRSGFEVGLELVVANWEDNLRPDLGAETCTSVLQALADLFAESGIADVSIPNPVEFQPWSPRSARAHSQFASFSFDLGIRRYDGIDVGLEKYAVVSFSPDQQQLWEILRTGFPTTSSKSDHDRRVATLYRDILVSRWQNGLSSVEWGVLGMFKGAACGIARAMRFGSLAVEGRILKRRHADALGQAVKVHLVDGTQQEVRLKLTYNASSREPEDTGD